MKRITALLIALLMLCLLVPAGVSAEEEKPFWITHFNDNTIEGSGVIFTDSYSGAGWWLHYAFAPTEEEGVYEIVDSSNGLADGSALSLEIPEGGFVWAANTGNDYISLGMGDTDYTSDNCSNCINDVLMNWMVGTLVKFNGLDLEGQTIPTTTADLNWYDDAYVCTATYTICEATAGDETEEPATSSEAESEAESSATTESVTISPSEPESSVAATSEAESDATEEDGGLSTGVLVAIIVAVVAIVAAVAVVLVKKKK
ncbi:MAG: hypothetical protein J6Q72_06315 [Clostridia bacterium]|nr:hypothetical protein [Clostridia bacterium]